MLEFISQYILGMELFNLEDLLKFFFRFVFNFTIIFSISRFIYFPISRKKEYLFTYVLISSVVFLICYLLDNVKLQMGLALGLFAIFGIIRYRTDAIPIREMTYIFIVIGLSVVNSLANKKISFAEILLANMFIFLITLFLEKVWFLKHEHVRMVQYEKIENIKQQNRSFLIEDLENRLGLKINRIDIGKINFLNDTALLNVYYYEEDQTKL